ncbi:MAG: hypothetical protein GY822_24330 [Deltaproteobacteria bacterium]|nr:hypothetical protein [Deltaproteobacteria bacterium]
MDSKIMIQIGRLLFTVALLAAIATAAPYTKWEALTDGLDEAKVKTGALVDVSSFSGDEDPKQPAKLKGYLTQALLLRDIKVIGQKDADGNAFSGMPEVIISGRLEGKGNEAKLQLTLSEGAKVRTIDVATDKAFPKTANAFWLSALLAAIGGVLWRRGVVKNAKAEAEAMVHDESGEGNPFALLMNLQAPLEQLNLDFGDLDNDSILERVDALIEEFIDPFTEARGKVTETLGMAIGAEILIDVAFGERMLNRVWSAASDDCYEEAVISLLPALDAFKRAHDKAEHSVGT